MGRIAALAVLVCACLLVAPALASAANGSIAGGVTEAAAGHAAIEGAQVCAIGIEEEDFGCDSTDATGAYEITGLTPDDYLVAFQAQDQGYLVQYFDHASSFEDADEVTVASAVQTPNIDGELIEGGRLEGTVIDAVSKTGVEDVEACAYLEEAPDKFEFGGCAEPDSSGDYEINGLADGDYVVEFWAFDRDYVFEFYADALFLDQATRVSVAAGSPATGVDAELEKGGRIAGTVVNAANGLPLEEIEVCAREGAAPNRYLRCTGTNGAGQYAIRGLRTGSYKVEFTQWDSAFTHILGIQFYSGVSTLASAQSVTVTAPGTTPGIDARFGTPPVVPPSTPPTPPVVHPAAKKVTCKKGFRKKMVKGKPRCVKRKKHHRRRKGAKHRAGRALFEPAPSPSRFLRLLP
jgi:hypothetical protein